jgi:hypothetical protein
MPSPLFIQRLSGPHSGQRLRFADAPVRFGRDDDNEVVLAEPFVSRHHGELRFDDARQRWELVNLSENGTLVNGSLLRAVNAKPKALRDGDTVAVGNQPVFTIHLGPAAATQSPADGQDAGETDQAPTAGELAGKPSSKRKLWIGIGIYLILMLGVMLFLLTLDKDASQEAGPPPVPELSAEQVRDAILAPLPPVRPPDPARADRLITEAANWYHQVGSRPDALYLTFDAYRQALACLNAATLPRGLDQQRFMEVRAQLLARVQEDYHTACSQLASGNAAAAAAGFRQLIDIYNDRNSVVYQNAAAQFNVADARLKQRKRGGLR